MSSQHSLDAIKEKQIHEDELFALELQKQFEAEEREQANITQRSENYSLVSETSHRSEFSKSSKLVLDKPTSLFSLLEVRDAPFKENRERISLEQLLQGELKAMVQFNYLIDVDWFMSKLPPNNREVPVLFVHGMSGTNSHTLMDQVQKYKNLKIHLPQLPPYGTHHTKTMILFYEDNIRIVIHTANLIERDWRNKAQAAYVSPLLEKKSPNSKPTAFEQDFLEYLTAYGNVLKSTREKLSRYDFSPCKGTIIGSVPGRHTGNELHKWGHMRIRNMLSAVELNSQFQDSTLIFQFSSIGSLGKTPDWLTKELAESFSRHHTTGELNESKRRRKEKDDSRTGQVNTPEIQLIFPTVEEVRNSFEGYAAGGSIPYDLKNFQNQQHYLQRYMCHWKARGQNLDRAMPHIKTYARVTNDGEELAWCIVTSANLSKAAWGVLEKKTTANPQLHIRSFELGVVYFPASIEPDSEVRLTTKKHPGEEPATELATRKRSTDIHNYWCPLPYDLPPTPYSASDRPWVWNDTYLEPDLFGATWPMET
ncbi:hypothetical protein K7432_008633 [Basidiobolus ranarum]|uniref:Tyrosyl-DNA phosphodiesterase 1 n=1 Tax=Basidiobolus ranarum TaxID=34480 RepID=A0ABR2WRL9_9FUNG